MERYAGMLESALGGELPNTTVGSTLTAHDDDEISHQTVWAEDWWPQGSLQTIPNPAGGIVATQVLAVKPGVVPVAPAVP